MARRVVRKKPRKSNKPCPYCEKGMTPDFRDLETLKVGLSKKMRIVSRVYTGVCQKHQRMLSREIKRARHLALIPFVQKS